MIASVPCVRVANRRNLFRNNADSIRISFVRVNRCVYLVSTCLVKEHRPLTAYAIIAQIAGMATIRTQLAPPLPMRFVKR